MNTFSHVERLRQSQPGINEFESIAAKALRWFVRPRTVPKTFAVEFVGLPGAGKSFLCEALSDYLEQNGLKDRVHFSKPADKSSKAELLFQKFVLSGSFALRHPKLTRRIVKIAKEGNQKIDGSILKKINNLLFELSRTKENKDDRLVVVEQGVLQAVWSINARTERDVSKDLLEVVANWLPDVVFKIEPDPDSYTRRLRSREGGQSFFDELNEDELAREVEAAREDLMELVDLWGLVKSDAKPKDMITIHNGSEPLECTIRMLVASGIFENGISG